LDSRRKTVKKAMVVKLTSLHAPSATALAKEVLLLIKTVHDVMLFLN